MLLNNTHLFKDQRPDKEKCVGWRTTLVGLPKTCFPFCGQHPGGARVLKTKKKKYIYIYKTKKII